MFDVMKLSLKKITAVLSIVLVFFSCEKDSFITSSNAFINFSADTLHFDTVFTSAGSVTQSFKIFNLNNEKLRISKIELSGGVASPFKINVNGVSGNAFSDVDIAANDSIYIFVSININPNQINTPFIINDSILINYNGNNEFLQLDAFGRNAHFLKNFIITHDTSFTDDLPFVILGSLTVNQPATLTINKGAEIFCHQDAGLIINGTLKINGEKSTGEQVIFKSDRLDDPYKFYPGSWLGITFSQTSINNEINSAIIENANTAVTIYGNANVLSQLKLNACIITNNLYGGIKAINSNVYAENCLITNCGLNNINLNAGIYNFVFCTVAGYSDILLSHAAPVLSVTDTITATQTAVLYANFTNSIFYGEEGPFEDEINVLKSGNSFTAKFENVLYKAQNLNASDFTNSINNIDPAFLNINQQDAVFDFHPAPASVCKDAGKAISIQTDLDGNPRTVGTAPDIGCYEIQ